MTIRQIDDLLAGHALFKDLPAEHVSLLAGCAINMILEPGETIFRQDEPADGFYLLRRGRVAVEIAVAGRGPIVVETLGPDDLLGWSWIVPPYRWHFDAKALELTRAIRFDGACIRAKFEEDPRLGYEMLSRFVGVVSERLNATRLRLLDLYGHPTRT